MKFIATRVAPKLLWLGSSVASVVLLVSLALPARADDPAASPSATPAKPLRTYTPKAGESLDRVIKQTMAGSPLSADVLRKAFVDLNPHAFVAGNASKMRAKVSLKVPDSQGLIQAVLAPHIQASLVAAAADEAKNMSGSTSGVSDERRHWVRYP